MLAKTTKKVIRYALWGILIITAALAISAYRSGVFNNNQQALEQDSARWVALGEGYDKKVQALSQDNAR